MGLTQSPQIGTYDAVTGANHETRTFSARHEFTLLLNANHGLIAA
jgi:hypothetical protein